MALFYVCTSLWSIQPQHDGNACSLLLKGTGHAGFPLFGRENRESWCMYVYVYMYITSTGSYEALTALSSNWSSSGICRDLLVYFIQVSMCVDIYKTRTYGCVFRVMYFHMNSFILRDRQGAVSGAAFHQKDSSQEWSPFGHLTSGGVRLRSLRLWTFSLLPSPTHLPVSLLLWKRWDTLIKALLAREHDSVFTGGYPMKHSQRPLTSLLITKIISEVEAGEKQGQRGEVEEEVINFLLYYLHPPPTASESQLCAQITRSHLQEITTIVIIIIFTQEFAGLNY